MQHHGRPLREALPANVAHVGSLADVRQQMDFLRAEAAEGFPANRAQVGLLPGMRPEVLGQAVLGLGLHAALLAHVLELVQLHVAVQVLLRLELLLAGGALVLLHLRLVLVVFVEVEGALAGIGGAADVADAGLRVVVLDVGGVIGLHLEHLAALLALVAVVLGVLPYVVDLQVGLRSRLVVA